MPQTKTAQQYVGLNALTNYHDRVTYIENWLKKPGINADSVIDPDADSASALAAYVIANRDFEVLGTSATTATVTFSDGGGIKLTTLTSASDSVIIAPHLDTNQTAWSATKWNTNDEVVCNALIQTGASIADTTVWYGLKLTNTPVVATDNDQAFFRYQDSQDGGNWQCIYSIGGTDYTIDSLVTAAASTDYDLMIRIDAQRHVSFYINDNIVHRSSVPLTADIDLIPYVGVLTGTTSAKNIIVRPGYAISKLQNN